MAAQAYPLQWPTGWPRAQARASAAFKQRGSDGWMKSATMAVARERLQRELDLLRVSLVTLSTNVELRLDGQPRSDRSDPTDPGVAVYFTFRGKQTVLACDRWNRVADNIIALAKHIEALRCMDRWGVGTAEQAFAGYQALPAPIAQRHWTAVLSLTADASIDQINAEYRRLAKAAAGDERQLLDLNLARDAAIAARNP